MLWSVQQETKRYNIKLYAFPGEKGKFLLHDISIIWISLVSLRILMKYLPPDLHINFYDSILRKFRVTSATRWWQNIQTFPCVHEYFPVYTSVHFPDHEMEQLCMCTVTRKFYLKSVLFSSQYAYPISNINIYFLLMFRSQEVGILEIPTICHLVESVLETGTIFKSHWKALQNIRICESYKSINVLYLKVEFDYMFDCDQ